MTTFSMMTVSMMTFSMTTVSITTLGPREKKATQPGTLTEGNDQYG
jgi:hypothetical protein